MVHRFYYMALYHSVINNILSFKNLYPLLRLYSLYNIWFWSCRQTVWTLLWLFSLGILASKVKNKYVSSEFTRQFWLLDKQYIMLLITADLFHISDYSLPMDPNHSNHHQLKILEHKKIKHSRKFSSIRKVYAAENMSIRKFNKSSKYKSISWIDIEENIRT